MSKETPLETLQGIFKELYKPEFVPKDLDLKSFYNIAEKEASEDLEKIYSDIRAFNTEGLPRNAKPLTGMAAIKKPINSEEAQIIEQKKNDLLDNCKRIKTKLNEEFEKIDKEAANWSHTFELKNRPKLRKAIQRVFGEKKNTITYSEYRRLLKIKKRLEIMEASDILKPEQKEENESSGAMKNILKDLI